MLIYLVFIRPKKNESSFLFGWLNFICNLLWKWISFLSIVTMTGTIKPFQFLQHLYQMMGILSPRPTDIFSINPKKLFILMGMITLSTSSFAYFLFETTFAQDYGESFYGFITKGITLVDFIVTVWKMPTILRLFKMYEKFIERSKWTKHQGSFIWIFSNIFHFLS